MTLDKISESMLDENFIQKVNGIKEDLAQNQQQITDIAVNVCMPPYNVSANGNDISAAVNQAIADVSNRGGGKVLIPFTSQSYMVDAVKSIQMKDNVTLELAGATLEAMPNNASNSAIIKGYDNTNFSIVGKGKLKGDRDSHIGETSPFGMGIDIRGCSNVYVGDVDIDNCWGDGIYISGSDLLNHCNNVVIERFKINNNRRQGISIISAKNLTIRDGVISNTNGQSPGDGIDIEPNFPSQYLHNIVIENVTTEENEGGGIKFFAGNMEGSNNPISITIRNHIDKNSQFGFRARSYIPNAKGFVKLENCEWENGTASPFRVDNWAASGPRIEAHDCTSVWSGTSVANIYAFDISRPNQTADDNILGNVHLYRPNLVVKDGANPPDRGIYLSPNSADSMENISIIDPINLPTTLANTQISVGGKIKNFKVSDRNKILHQSVPTGISIHSNRYKRSYDNTGATGTISIFLGSGMDGQIYTIVNTTGTRLQIKPPSGGIIFPFATAVDQYIYSTKKGDKVTIVCESDGFYVTEIIGTWTVA